MARTATNTREELIRAAFVIVDEQGYEALTLRSLGAAVGMHHTAVFRHFKTKDELLQEMLVRVLGEGFAQFEPGEYGPAERIVVTGVRLRSVLAEHPALIHPLLGNESTSVEGDAIQSIVVSALTELGLAGRDLTVRYQAIESFALGSIYFDFADYPRHAEGRRNRHRRQGGDMATASATNAAVEELNRAAYEYGLQVLVAECVQAGKR